MQICQTNKTLDWTAIIEDGNKPRSIREIKEKYQLSFPFSVRRVVSGPNPNAHPVGSIIEVTGFVYDRFCRAWHVDCEPIRIGAKLYVPGIDLPHYVLWD